MSEKPSFDRTQMYYRHPYKVNDMITIYQPSVGDIVKYGELKFYNTVLSPFITNPTSCRVFLWDNGIDWNKFSDFELFSLLIKNLEPGSAELIFKDFSFAGFEAYGKELDGKKEIVLWDRENDRIITEQDYVIISGYLRTLFNIFPKVEHIIGKQAKIDTIEEDRLNAKLKEKEEEKPFLLPLISACMNHPGFKYKIEDLDNLGIYAFMDSVERLQIYESSIALLRGAYSGFMDTSKVDQSEMNFMRAAK